MRILKSLLAAVCVLAFGAGPLAAANSIFVTVDGLSCHNTDARHRDAFNAMSFSFGASQGIGNTGAGQTQSGPTAGDMVVMKNFDGCTPGLLKYLARGSHIPSVVLEWQTQSANPVVFMKITLEEVLVSNINYGSAQEGVSFSWQTMTLTYWVFKADGTLGTQVTVRWDKATNTVS